MSAAQLSSHSFSSVSLELLKYMCCCIWVGLMIGWSLKCIWGHSIQSSLSFSCSCSHLSETSLLHPFSIHRGSRSSPNLISEITNQCLVDHLNPISAHKDHNTLPFSRSAIYQPPLPFCCRVPKIRNILTKLRSWPGGVTRMWGMEKAAQMALWMGLVSSGSDDLDGSLL